MVNLFKYSDLDFYENPVLNSSSILIILILSYSKIICIARFILIRKYCGVAPRGPLLLNGYASSSSSIGND
jgi:hypothetical protein